MINACEVLKNLGVPEDRWTSLIPGWGQAMTNMPEQIEILCPEAVREVCRLCSLDEYAGQLVDTAETISASAALRSFFWHTFFKLSALHYTYGNYATGFGGWPNLHPLSDRSGLFYLLAALGLMPEALRTFRAMNLPENVIKDTLNLKANADFYRNVHGQPGLDPSVIAWVRHYAAGRIITLGRFQYKTADLFAFGAMLRNRADGRKLLVAEDGLRCDQRGYVVQNGCEADSDWDTSFMETEDSVSGYAVAPEGFILPGKRNFSKQEWEVILRKGDVLLDMHIPPGGKMTPEAAFESFSEAFRFFADRYPGRFVPAIICRSWIFNTQFEELLPDSNLAKLMRKCYLFPCASSGKDGFFFLFGRDYTDLKEAPHDTSVRRAMLSVLERGDRLRLGGMLFFQDDLNHYHENIYRTQFKI